MTILIYMNEQLHNKKPKTPVMTVVHGRKKYKVNSVDIQADDKRFDQEPAIEIAFNTAIIDCATCLIRHDPKGCPKIKTHTVKAWLELD